MKTILRIISVLLYSVTLMYAQTPEWSWANCGGGTSLDYGTSISLDSNRNLFLTGWFSSSTITFGSTVLTNTGMEGTSDIFIAKYDPKGILLWVESFGGKGEDRSISIKTNSNGDFFLTGWFKSPVLNFSNNTLTNKGGSDIFIACFSREGKMLWAKSAGGNADDEGNSISCNKEGDLFVTGMYESSFIMFDGISLPNKGQHDIYLASYNIEGNILWAKDIGGKDDDTGSTITNDGDGNIYLTGKFNSSEVDLSGTILKNAGKNGNYGDIFMAKYNPSGKLLWGKSLGGSYYDEGYSIASDMLGNVYLTGWFKSDTIIFGCDTLMECTILTRAHGVDYGDIFIAKYDTYGNPVWAQRAGGMAKDYGFGITTDAIGDVYLTGVFESNFISFGQVKLKNATSNDIFISKYSPEGKVIWAKSIYGSAMSRSITTDLYGDVYLAGVFDSPEMKFGSTLLTNAGKGDIFVAKLK